jgi:arylsulfatase A-like enzyme
VFVVLLLISGQQALAGEGGTSRPNILFIYTDDQSHRTVSCYPEAYPWARTPQIDRLAKRGIRFAHAYIGTWCMPSRAMLLTGHDLTPLLKNPKAEWKHPVLLTLNARVFGSDTNRVPTDPKERDLSGIPWWVFLVEGRYKYIRTLVKDEIEELYDLQNDPEELTNLALDPAYARKLKSMRKATRAELRRTGAGMVDHLPPVGVVKK